MSQNELPIIDQLSEWAVENFNTIIKNLKIDEREVEIQDDPNTIPQYLIPDNIDIFNCTGSSNANNASYAKIDGGYCCWNLPLPTSINYDSDYRWDDENTSWQDMISGDILNETLLHGGLNPLDWTDGKKLVNLTKELVRGVASKKSSEQSVKYALMKDKVAYNPNKQLYFNDVEMREFSFKFDLIPMSKSEAEDIKKGFISLAYSASPSYNSSDFFFNYPSMFNIVVKTNGLTLLHLKNLAIIQLNLDLAPEGQITWHEDGFPTAMTLDIQFKESQVPTRENLSKIEIFGTPISKKKVR